MMNLKSCEKECVAGGENPLHTYPSHHDHDLCKDKDNNFSLYYNLNIFTFYLNNLSLGRPKSGAHQMSVPQEGCFITATL